MEPLKENQNPKMPGTNDVKKRPSLASPFSAASPSVRPLQKKVRPLYETGDQNIDATLGTDDMSRMEQQSDETLRYDWASFEATGHVDSNIEEALLQQTDMHKDTIREEKSSCSAVPDSNLEETRVESTVYEQDLTQAAFSEELDDTIYKTTFSTKFEGGQFNKEKSDFRGVADGNLEETAAESTVCEEDLTQTMGSEELDDTINKTISSLQLERSEFDKERDDCCNPVDSFRQETAVESTVCEDFTQTIGSEEFDGAINETITCLRLGSNEFNKERGNYCNSVDGNLEETAVESTVCEEDLTQTMGCEELDDTISKTISSLQLKRSEFDKERDDCCNPVDSFRQETAVESGVCEENFTQTTGSEEADGTINETITCLRLGSNEFNKERGNYCNPVDGNLEETAVESTVCEEDLTQTMCCEELDDTISKTISSLQLERSEFDKERGDYCNRVDSNLEETAVESTVCEEDLTQTTGCEEFDDTINKTTTCWRLESSDFNREAGNYLDTVDGNLEGTAVESTVDGVDLTQATGCEELDGAVNETITCNEHERPEKSETASFSSSLMDDNSMLGVNHSSVAEWQSGLKRSLSPITCLSKRDSSASSSSTLAPLHLSTRQSPVFSTDRKYNLNDSDISFLINENRVYDMALRKTSNSPHETEQLKKNLIALEEEMSMVLEQLQSLSDELEKYRTKSTSQNSELLEANRKLSEVTKSKEYAERTVADYEFIVEDLKKRHTKQKEHLLDKVLSLEDELDKLRSQCASQSQLALTSLSIKNDLSVVNERLLLEEKARATAEERCETLAKELQLSLSTATSYANELAIANENATSIAAKLSLLENRVNEKDSELITLRERNEKECMEIQMKLKEAEAALVKSKEEVGDLLKQLAASEDSLAVVREAHTNSEMELMSIKDELERFEIALRQSEECRLEASTQCSAIEKELNSVRVKLDSLEQIETTVERLKNECARLEEELCAEKLGYDILNREVEQLRREKNACNEALEEISFALREAETRASIAEKDLLNHTKCHTEELRSRIVELEAQIAVYPAERESLENKLSEQMKKETVALAKNEKTVEALEKAEAEIADLRKAKNDLQNEVRLMKVSHEDYTARTEKLATTVVELEVQVDLLQCERDELKYKMVVADEKYMKATATAEEMIDSLKSDIESGLSERELLCNRLAAAENSKGILENDLAEVNVVLNKLKEELAALVLEKTMLEKKLSQQEQDYMEKTSEFNKMRNCMMELESTIDMLKSEARGKSEELVATNEKLKAEIAAHEQTANAFTSLEKEYLRLKKEKETFYIELEEQKKCYAFEVQTAQKIVEEMKQELAKLQNEQIIEKDLARLKLEEMTKEISRMEQEICESKASRFEADVRLTELHQRFGELVAEKQQLEARLSDLTASADRMEQTAKRPSDFDEELKKLRKQLEIKSREIDRLAGLCDEFDEIEENYRRGLFAAIKERDQLKAQLNALKTPEHPNLEVAFMEGMEALTLETPFGHSNADVNLRSREREDVINEIQELRRRCSLQERRISELEKICDEADESEERMKSEITELTKQVAALRRGDSSNSSKTPTSSMNGSSAAISVPSSDMCGDGIKVASSSQKLFPDAHNVSAGPTTEDSVLEAAGTPNRTLRTAIYKGLDKTTKLSDSPGRSKANNSRCTHQ